MILFSLTFLYFVIIIMFFYSSHYLLMSLVVLELASFCIIIASYISVSLFVSSSFTLFVFCIFVLESVLGLVGLLNLVYFSGSDYIMPSFSY